MSTNNVSPASLLGGTWTPIRGKFLLSESDGYTAGTEGGESSHTLTTNEMPHHNHAYNIGTTTTASHTHNNTSLNYFSADPQPLYWGGYTNAGAIGGTGGGASHNNMPPYLAVYMWQRTE